VLETSTHSFSLYDTYKRPKNIQPATELQQPLLTIDCKAAFIQIVLNINLAHALSDPLQPPSDTAMMRRRNSQGVIHVPNGE
jgi:hypothetical protein